MRVDVRFRGLLDHEAIGAQMIVGTSKTGDASSVGGDLLTAAIAGV